MKSFSRVSKFKCIIILVKSYVFNIKVEFYIPFLLDHAIRQNEIRRIPKAINRFHVV